MLTREGRRQPEAGHAAATQRGMRERLDDSLLLLEAARASGDARALSAALDGTVSTLDADIGTLRRMRDRVIADGEAGRMPDSLELLLAAATAESIGQTAETAAFVAGRL